MPPDPEYVVPVIAHRVYGRRNTAVDVVIRSPSDDEQYFGEDHTRLAIEGSLRGNRQVMDRSHGTTHVWPAIRAMFVSDASAPGSDGTTVNDLWAETGIRFQLVEEADAMISSAFADFMPSHDRPTFEPLRRPGGINVFYLRDLEGRRGNAHLYRPNRSDDVPYLLMSDQLEASEEPGPNGRWQRVLVTLAHEFGHVLGLGHFPGWENTMSVPASRGFEAPQIATCRYRGAFLSGAAAPPSPRRPPPT